MMHENECTGHWSMNSESVQQVAKLPSAGGTVLIKGHKGPEAALDGWRSLLSGQLALPGSLSCIHSIIHLLGLLLSIQLFFIIWVSIFSSFWSHCRGATEHFSIDLHGSPAEPGACGRSLSWARLSRDPAIAARALPGQPRSLRLNEIEYGKQERGRELANSDILFRTLHSTFPSLTLHTVPTSLFLLTWRFNAAIRFYILFLIESIFKWFPNYLCFGASITTEEITKNQTVKWLLHGELIFFNFVWFLIVLTSKYS